MRKHLRHWATAGLLALLAWVQLADAARVNGRENVDGVKIQCDLPGSLHLRNTGGSDGAGLCVFTSIAHSARWQNIPLLVDFRDWMRKYPGGGYPEKVTAKINQIAKEKGVEPPEYIQVVNRDLEILRKACASGRMVCVTYSVSPTGRYGGSRIAHMVNLVHADKDNFVILDNNYPGDNSYEWLNEEEFLRTYAGRGSGWAVIFLTPGPPPAPMD